VNEAESFLARPWGRMAWRDSGGVAAPMVFLHGTGCDSDDWGGVFEALPSGMRRVTLDFRGHGRSSTPEGGFVLDDLAADVRFLLDALGLERVALAGHSLGGMVALAVARHDRRVAGLALLEGWVALSRNRRFGPGHNYGLLSAESVRSIEAKRDQTRARFRPEEWAAFAGSVRAADASDVVAAAEIPVLSVYGRAGGEGMGREDLLLPAKPNIELMWLEGAGHYLPHERPREVADACALAMRRARLG